jgi:hypothetical protein
VNATPVSRRKHEPGAVRQNALGALAPAFHKEFGQRLVGRGCRAAKQLVVARRDAEMDPLGLGL